MNHDVAMNASMDDGQECIGNTILHHTRCGSCVGAR